MHHIELKKAPEVAKLITGYHDRTRAVLLPFNGPINLASYWSYGSRTWFKLVNLENGETVTIGESGGVYQPAAPTLDTLPLNCALVETSVFSGKEMPARIHLHPDNITKFIPSSPELTDEERKVLVIIRSLKSFAREEAARSAGIDKERLQVVKNRLASLGLLTKAGAITVAGRNAAK